MNPIGFCLRAWESWGPDHKTDKAELMPALSRRRVTPLGRYTLNAAWGLPEIADARFILSSRHGEFSRTLSLMEAAADGRDLSPADFTLSVHHALIGLLSIAHRNRKGHIAVASGRESFCFGLLEAMGCLKENPHEPVVLIHFDESLPGVFSTFNEPEEKPIALALALGATGKGETLHFDVTAKSSMDEKPSASHAQDFLDFLAGGVAQGLSMGEHRQWRWARHALA